MPNKLLAFDPGGSTGWATAEIQDEEVHYDGGTFSLPDHHSGIRALITEYHPDLVIYEQFEFRQQANANEKYRKGLNLMSREYIGVIKLTCFDLDIPTKSQPPPFKDTRLVSDENLDKLGVLRRPIYPNRHYHDAQKHLNHFMIQTLRHAATLNKVRMGKT